jgi:hypothetical protein
MLVSFKPGFAKKVEKLKHCWYMTIETLVDLAQPKPINP